MAKKTNKPTAKQMVKDRTKLEWLLIILLLIFIWLLLASRFGWWPWDGNNAKLGSAFYSSSQEAAVANTTPTPAAAGGGAGGSGNTGGTGDTGGGTGGGGTGGGGGGTTTTSSSSLIDFAAGVNKGDTKEKISGQSNGLDERCTVVVNDTVSGKQEVCTYTEGDKVVTVTYLNDRVVSASRSGF